jgi:hypothetical protein
MADATPLLLIRALLRRNGLPSSIGRSISPGRPGWPSCDSSRFAFCRDSPPDSFCIKEDHFSFKSRRPFSYRSARCPIRSSGSKSVIRVPLTCACGSWPPGKFYPDTTWKLSCANESVRFKNSLMTWSWFSTFGKVHLRARNSNLDNPAVEGPGTLEVYDSKVGRVQMTGATALVYVENSLITRYVQVENAGSLIYTYGVHSSIPTNPFAILEVNGGKYQVLSSPGKPWQ